MAKRKEKFSGLWINDDQKSRLASLRLLFGVNESEVIRSYIPSTELVNLVAFENEYGPQEFSPGQIEQQLIAECLKNRILNSEHPLAHQLKNYSDPLDVVSLYLHYRKAELGIEGYKFTKAGTDWFVIW